jgi:ribosomal-protein-alanine N-acetyltransferase
MRIRKPRAGELARVIEVERAAFGPDSYSVTTFLAHLFRDRKGVFVAEDERGQVVGFVLVRLGLGWLRRRRRGGITSLAVEAAHRRQGIGTTLMARALEYLRENNVQEVDLEVGVTNQAAVSLYHTFGFQRSRLLPHYYGANRDGMRMVLDLAAAAGTNRVRQAETCEGD